MLCGLFYFLIPEVGNAPAHFYDFIAVYWGEIIVTGEEAEQENG